MLVSRIYIHRSMISDGKLPCAAAIITAIIFGFSFLFTKNALDSLNFFQLLGLRFMIAALFLTFLKLIRLIKLDINKQKIKDLILIAIFQPVIYFMLETVGVDLTTTSESGVIISLEVISATLFAGFFLKERVTKVQWASVIVSVAGVALIVLAGKDLGSVNGHLTGIGALLGAVAATGLYSVFSRKVSTSCTPMEITFVMMWAGAVVFNTAGISRSLVTGGISSYISGLSNINVIIDIIFLGTISSVLAFFFMNYSLSKLEASRATVFLNLTPVISVLAGVTLRGERFYLLQCAGLVLVLTGVWGTNFIKKNAHGVSK